MQKNHSKRTFDKQIELTVISRSYIDARKITKLTYIDANGGTARYVIEGNVCKGGCVVVHDMLKQAAETQPGFEYNGYIFENGPEEWALLNQNLPNYCPDHKFSLFKEDSLEGDRSDGKDYLCISGGRPPVKLISQPHNEGIIYFDPHADISPTGIAQWAAFQPNYLVICNTQRNTIIRNLWRTEGGSSVARVVSQVQRHWLISPPVCRLGWSWLVGAPDAATATKLAEVANRRYDREFLFPLSSPAGQACYALMTREGLNIRRYFSNDFKYHGTVATH